ncbi:MAG: helix-turn-helix domain-containing protein [Metallibacterium scheffleri]|jgi:transcriptional regulator with XRE-family HTH domain|uniref:helix-turn-helix domain-containing protein n=1 Tax=Metallibacterium scheffleri TaxID=993689 RepID=UPI0026F2FA48|nr:helix-turn-helix transcriptional regulator [Metallibacterium scheffleri]MCK9366593.1 helix-turn-helix domain-containing protein [Metallibacterium scheffleri]
MAKKNPLVLKLGQAIRARRLAIQLSQDDFADRIHMHRAYYSAIERGEKNVTLATLHRVAKGLGVTMSSLLIDVD